MSAEQPVWKKATASEASSGCVTVAELADGTRLVRDSKQGESGPILSFTRAEWDAFLDGARNGEFD